MKKVKRLFKATSIVLAFLLVVVFNGGIVAQAQSNVRIKELSGIIRSDETNNSNPEEEYDFIGEECDGKEAEFIVVCDSKENKYIKNQIVHNQINLKQAKKAAAHSGFVLGSITPTETGFKIGFTNPGPRISQAKLRLIIKNVAGKPLKRLATMITNIPSGSSTHMWNVAKNKTVQESVELDGVVGVYDIPKTYTVRYNFEGGRYSRIDPLDGHRHHMPSVAASPLSRGKGPCITMLISDHKFTASYGNTPISREFAAKERQLIKNGSFLAAQNMGINDIRTKFGKKYNKAIRQMRTYTASLGYKK